MWEGGVYEKKYVYVIKYSDDIIISRLFENGSGKAGDEVWNLLY